MDQKWVKGRYSLVEEKEQEGKIKKEEGEIVGFLFVSLSEMRRTRERNWESEEC